MVNEYKHLQPHFKEIQALALYGDEPNLSEAQLNYPHLHIHAPVLPAQVTSLKLFLKGFFNLAPFHFHLFDFFNKKVFLSYKKFYIFLSSLLVTRSILASKGFKQVLTSLPSDTSQPIVFYFYWGDNAVWILPYLKKYLQRHGIKSIIRFHGSDLYEFLKADYAPLRQLVFEQATYLCPVSEAGYTYLKNKYLAYQTKLLVQRLGVNDFGLAPFSTTSPKVIVSVSNIIALKRVELIFKALQQLQQPVIWHHFGSGTLELALQAEVKKAKPHLTVHLHGQVSNQTLMAFYQSTSVDVFVNVSTTEGVPVSIMEALSFGIPVIATQAGGTAELVTNEVGLVIPIEQTPNSLQAIFDRFFKMALPNQLEMRQQARLRYLKLADAKQNYAAFTNLIKGLQVIPSERIF